METINVGDGGCRKLSGKISSATRPILPLVTCLVLLILWPWARKLSMLVTTKTRICDINAQDYNYVIKQLYTMLMMNLETHTYRAWFEQ